MRGEKGFALVITLIVTALLVALLVEFVNETYVDTSHSHNFVASQQAGVLAESGAAMARGLLEMELSTLPGLGHGEYSSLLDTWAQPIRWEDDTGTLTVTIEQETGKLNLNSVNNQHGSDKNDPYPYQTLMRNLLVNLKLPPELCDSLVDWVNAVDKPPQPNGAKSPYYNSLKPPYNVKGAALDTVEELGLVKGFTGETVAKLKPYVTVYDSLQSLPDHANKLNVNTAPPGLLASIKGMTPDMVTRILDFRKTKPVKYPADLQGLGTFPPALYDVVNYGKTSDGSVFRIRAEGRVSECVSVAEAVVRLQNGSSQILYWREY